jgi:hypothetical protein
MVKKSKTLQTLTDPKLEPFFITVDEYCYTVKEKITSDITHFKSNGVAKEYEKSLFYFPDLGSALSKIIDLKTGSKDFDSLKEYLNEYKNTKNEIKEYANQLRSTI